MPRLPRPTARLLLPLAGLAALAGCVVNLSFDMNQTVALDAVGTSVSTVQPFDLGQYPEVQQHKNEVQSLGLDSVDLLVTAVATANKANSVSGTLALRPDGATDASHDVQVGVLTNVSTAQGTRLHIPGNPAVDAFLLSVIKGSGKFSAVIAGTTTPGEAHITVQATLHASLGYGSGL